MPPSGKVRPCTVNWLRRWMSGWWGTGDQRIQRGVDEGRIHGGDDKGRSHGGVDGGRTHGELDGQWALEWPRRRPWGRWPTVELMEGGDDEAQVVSAGSRDVVTPKDQETKADFQRQVATKEPVCRKTAVTTKQVRTTVEPRAACPTTFLASWKHQALFWKSPAVSAWERTLMEAISNFITRVWCSVTKWL